MTVEDARRLGCPVVHTNFTLERPAGWHHHELDALRDTAPLVFNDATFGFWMVQRFDQVREGLQLANTFSTRVTSALGRPDDKPMLIPQNVVGPMHNAYRQVLNPWFSPKAIERTEPFARARCIELIEELAPRRRCDMALEFAMQFATEVFLHHLGLPVEDGPMLLPLVDAMFRGFFGGDPDETRETVHTIKSYFRSHVADRTKSPRDPRTDFVSYIMSARLAGEALPHEDAITLAFTIMLAGLDTTRSALGYIFTHLSLHDDDRHWLAADRARTPGAVEEFLRLYGLVFQAGRYVEHDVDFHGCPLRQGDIVWFGLAQASRDPAEFDRATEFVPERTPNRHLAFGAGPHFCLGAHLARKELILVLDEWLARIPDFRLETTELRERGGQLALRSVPLVW